MPNILRSNILVVLLLTLALGMFSCKSGVNNRSILGGKKNKNKNFFDRYLPKTFHAKKYPKTKVLPKADEQEGDGHQHQQTATEVAPIPAEETTTATTPEVSENAATTNASSTTTAEQTTTDLQDEEIQSLMNTDIQTTRLSTGILAEENNFLQAAKDIVGSNQKEISIESVKNAAAFFQATGHGKKAYLGDFKKSIITLHQKAEKKGKSYVWVMYFAIVQGFTALFLGFKQIFNMLDSPIDSGNKALGISYAAIAILAIHAMLLIGLVKNFV